MDDYAHTISGLLRKRGEMPLNLAGLSEQVAVITNDLASLERVLETLGYLGELPAKTAKPSRVILFYRGELRAFVKQSLQAHGPSSTRAIAERLVQTEGTDRRDRRMMVDIVRRVGRSLAQMRDTGTVERARTVQGEQLWRLVAKVN
jgi:hypothetical protein